MSHIHAEIWLIGIPKCCAAHCQQPIQDPTQVIVVAHNQGNMGFCSLPCFLEAFRPAPALASVPEPSVAELSAPEPSGEPDLLLALGYRHPHEGSAAE